MMKTSESIVKISVAVVAAQAQIKTVTKDGVNTFFKKPNGDGAPYATLDSIIEACKGPFEANKLAVIQVPTEVETKPVVITRVLHESGEYFEVVTPLILSKNDMQGFGAAVTYAKRFALGSFFNIATEVDDDGNAATGKGKEADKKPNDKKPEDKKPAAKVFDKKDQFVFEGGRFQGQKFADVMPEDFDGELQKYEAVNPKSASLQGLIDRMKQFKTENRKTA